MWPVNSFWRFGWSSLLKNYPSFVAQKNVQLGKTGAVLSRDIHRNPMFSLLKAPLQHGWTTWVTLTVTIMFLFLEAQTVDSKWKSQMHVIWWPKYTQAHISLYPEHVQCSSFKNYCEGFLLFELIWKYSVLILKFLELHFVPVKGANCECILPSKMVKWQITLKQLLVYCLYFL